MKTIEKLFDRDGMLSEGTHVFSKEDFLSHFCSLEAIGAEGELPRSRFYKPFFDICEWADEAGATSIVIGGSFVSKKINPSDIDLLIFFTRSGDIPKSLESFYVDGVLLDIQLLAEDEPDIKSAYLELLSTTRSNIKHGLVQIKFNSKVFTHESPAERSKDFEIVKVSYLGRKYAQLSKMAGLVVPIHGIRTHAEWIPQVSMLAGISGWAVAPYYYGYQGATILGDSDAKKEAVQGLRRWLSNIRLHWQGPISIIAHSFGTYLVARYLSEADDLMVEIDSIIFCGSIVNTDYSWSSLLDGGKIGKVLNTISSQDEWVRLVPDRGHWPMNDQLMGRAGWAGFQDKHARLSEIKSSLLDHNNIFNTDVILGQWIPFLRLSIGAYHRSNFELLRSTFKNDLSRQG